jgi:hypothetical protein
MKRSITPFAVCLVMQALTVSADTLFYRSLQLSPNT